jgi:hypothetical protein
MACFCEHGNEPSNSIKHEQFLGEVSYFKFKKYSARRALEGKIVGVCILQRSTVKLKQTGKFLPE